LRGIFSAFTFSPSFPIIGGSIGHPDPKHISTSFVEHQNWSVRSMMRRYTRLSDSAGRLKITRQRSR
jgi:hypothetical protein